MSKTNKPAQIWPLALLGPLLAAPLGITLLLEGQFKWALGYVVFVTAALLIVGGLILHKSEK